VLRWIINKWSKPDGHSSAITQTKDRPPARARGRRMPAAEMTADMDRTTRSVEVERIQADYARRRAELELDELRTRQEYENQQFWDRTNAHLLRLELFVKVFLAGALVLGTIVAVFVGIIQRLPGDELAQYLSPVSGLAGIAVGYFFGRTASGGGGSSTGSS
jgi:hypothetical protein